MMTCNGNSVKFFGWLPESLRRPFWRLKLFLAERVKTLRSWISPSVFVVSGAEESTGEALSFLYCGDDMQYRNYVGHLAFGQSAGIEDLGRMLVWRIRAILKGAGRPCSAAWVEWNPVSRLVLKFRNALTLPRWVEAWIDIPASEEEFRKKHGFKDVLRRIRKQGYSYVVTRDRKLYDHFYYTMYVPSIRGIHGDNAYIISYPFYQRIYDSTDLLLVEQDNEYVAGVLIQYEDGDAMLAYVGFKDGDYSFVRDGAAGAVDYFAAQWLRDRGYCRASLGGSKAFLNDGVLRGKMLKEGYLRMRKHIRDENLIFLCLEEDRSLREFLLNNPFLTYTGKGAIEGVLFADPSIIGDEAAAEALVRPYLNYRGIDGWKIYAFGDPEAGTRRVVGPETGATITVGPVGKS